MTADNEARVVILGKKAFVSTLVAIALNPIGIAIGYGVGKWLQAPKLAAPTVLVDAQTEGVKVPAELMPVLQSIGIFPFSFRLHRSDHQNRLRQGVLSSELVPSILADASESKTRLASYRDDLAFNIDLTKKWVRGQTFVPRPIDREGVTSEAPQTIVNRDKNELLGIYQSHLNDTASKLEGLMRLIIFLQSRAQGRANAKLGF